MVVILLGSRLIIEKIVKILKIGKSAAKHLLYIRKGVDKMEFKLASGVTVSIDQADYEKLPTKIGWYEQKESQNNAKTSYVVHDKYGRLHRVILGIKDPNILVDHIDRDGLNNRRNNLRIVSNSENKRNQETVANNKFNFNGLSYEKPNRNRMGRIKVRYSTNEYDTKTKRYKAKTKSFGEVKYRNDYNKMVRDAVLFRLEKMKEFGYTIDERSETIERKCKEDNYNMEKILDIVFDDIFK